MRTGHTNFEHTQEKNHLAQGKNKLKNKHPKTIKQQLQKKRQQLQEFSVTIILCSY